MIKENSKFKEMIKGFEVIVLYFILSIFSYSFLSLFGIDYNKLNDIFKQVYLVLYEVGTLLIIVFIYKKEFFTNFKEFRKNIFNNIKKYFKYWIVMLILMILSNYIVSIFTTSNTPQNQQEIIKYFKLYPFYTFFSTIIIAPILEELVYRMSIKKMFSDTKVLFIIISGLFFGFMHVIGTLTSYSDLLFIIPYSIPGFIFAYLYSKTDNIFTPISIHLIHNLLMFITNIIIIFL